MDKVDAQFIVKNCFCYLLAMELGCVSEIKKGKDKENTAPYYIINIISY